MTPFDAAFCRLVAALVATWLLWLATGLPRPWDSAAAVLLGASLVAVAAAARDCHWLGGAAAALRRLADVATVALLLAVGLTLGGLLALAAWLLCTSSTARWTLLALVAAALLRWWR